MTDKFGGHVSDEETISILADPVEKIACRKCGAHLDVSRMASFSSVVCPQCGLKQMVPALLGQFLLLELLGAGGMGAVYKALDQALGRYVAIKVMKRAMGTDPQFVENFLREARAAAAINHRNVVQIYSCGQEKGQPYIVMEMISGGRLDEQISKGDPLDEVRVLEIGIGVAEGLKAAQDMGLIHGDIKPANILFDKEHTPKVADFGLARFIAWQQNRGEVWGTPYYIAPEKARGQKEDHRSDIYSLGATLYHALGAKPPFDGQTATDVVLARLKNPAVSIRVVRPSLQPETADVIGRMLEADPFMRYPTYPSLLTDLREAHRLAKQESGGVRRKEKKTSLAPVIGLVAGLALLIIILGVVLYRVVTRPEQKPPQPSLPSTMRIGTASPASPAQPTEPTPAVNPPEPGPAASANSPFSDAMEPVVRTAIQQMTEGQVETMRLQLQRLQEGLEPACLPACWLQLLDGVGALAAGREAEVQTVLEGLRNQLVKTTPEVPDLRMLAQLSARYLLKEIGEEEVRQEAARWPAGYNDLVTLFAGLAGLRMQDLEKAGVAFSDFAGLKGGEPAWVYSFQPAARAWREQVSGFRFQKDAADQWIEEGQGARARATWEDFQRKTSPLLYPSVDVEIARARELEAREEAGRLLAEEKARGEKIQQDLDRLDAARAANLPVVARKDYRTALQNLLRVGPELQTPEGQKTLASIREGYERMDELKKYLIVRIGASPFPGGAGSELGGETAGADAMGIKVALGRYGEMVRTWEEISVRMYMQLITYYLGASGLGDAERANLTLSIAVFCYENGGFRAAANYADQSVKLDTNLLVKTRILMPDILPE